MSVVLAHPERSSWNDAALGRMLRWRRSFGMLIQVTAGSLLGTLGPRPRRLGWYWLESGVVDLIASDAHDSLRRPPLLRAAWEAVSARLGQAVAWRTMCRRPATLIDGSPVGRAALARESVAGQDHGRDE